MFTYLNIFPLGGIMDPKIQIYSAVVAVAVICYLVYDAYSIRRRLNKENFDHMSRRLSWLMFAYRLLAALYVIGNGFKFLVIGPQVIRFYLADFGFPAFVSATIGILLLHNVTGMGLSTANIVKRLAPKMLRWVIPSALMLSYTYESFMGYAHAVLGDELQGNPIGTFDWWDILAYTLGAITAYLIMRRILDVAIIVQAEYDERMASVTTTTRATAPKPKRNKPRKKRGPHRAGRI